MLRVQGVTHSSSSEQAERRALQKSMCTCAWIYKHMPPASTRTHTHILTKAQRYHMLMRASACRADIEECAEVDASQMTAKLDYVGIERLENYIGKKVCCLLMSFAYLF